MRTFVVKFIPDNNLPDFVIHKIQIPDYHDKGFYRIIGSWDSFSSGKLKGSKRDITRRQPCWSPTGLYYTGYRTESEWLEQNQKLTAKYGHKFDETKLPFVEHKSLYDFFEYIGFNRKTRRYNI